MSVHAHAGSNSILTASVSRSQGLKGNNSRFINHSCSGNLTVERWKRHDVDEFEVSSLSSQSLLMGLTLRRGS